MSARQGGTKTTRAKVTEGNETERKSRVAGDELAGKKSREIL